VRINNKKMSRINLSDSLISFNFSLVARRTTKRQQPNLRSKRFNIDGRMIRLKICASCLKKINSETKAKVAAAK
jgi:ribosomal protein L28